MQRFNGKSDGKCKSKSIKHKEKKVTTRSMGHEIIGENEIHRGRPHVEVHFRRGDSTDQDSGSDIERQSRLFSRICPAANQATRNRSLHPPADSGPGSGILRETSYRSDQSGQAANPSVGYRVPFSACVCRALTSPVEGSRSSFLHTLS